MERKRKRLFWWLAISIWLFSFYLAEAAWAEDYYFPAQDITTNQTNTSIDAIAKTANSGPEPPLASNPGVYITNVVIDGTLKSGDYVTVTIKDWQGNQLQQNFSSLPINYSPPAGAAYWLNYTLHTSSTPGWRQTYYVQASNNLGVVSHWETPAPPPADDTTAPSLLDYLQNPPLPPAPPSPPSISIPPAGTFDGTGPGYTPPNIAIPPPPSFNPAPPAYSPPAGRGPFIYEPPDFAVPAPIESPPPLPPIPNPEDYLLPAETPLPQQPPLQRDAVTGPQPPLARQEPHQDPPLARQEPRQDPPLARQEPQQDPPLARDPVLSRQTPLTPEQPLTPEPALARQAPGSAEPPLARQAPLAQDAPLTRDAPLQPEPPLTPTPPLGS